MTRPRNLLPRRRGILPALAVLLALLVGPQIAPGPAAPTSLPSTRPVASTAVDYRAALRSMFAITTSLATDAELDGLLSSDVGDALRWYVDTGTVGLHVLDPTDSAQAARDALVARALDYVTLKAAVTAATGSLLRAGTGLYKPLFTTLATGGDVVGGLEQAAEAFEIIKWFVDVATDDKRRFLISAYRDARDQQGMSAEEAAADLEGTFADVVTAFGQPRGLTNAEVYAYLECAYTAMSYAYDPDRQAAVRDFVTGMVALKRYYETSGPAAGRGVAMVSRSSTMDLIAVVNDGPAALSGLRVVDDGGATVLGPLFLSDRARLDAETAGGQSLAAGSRVTFRIHGMAVSLALAEVAGSLWVGQATALPVTDQPMAVAVAIDDPASPLWSGGAPDISWQFGEGAPAAGARAVHTYACPGAYTITALVTAGSRTVTRTVAWTVKDPVTVRWTAAESQVAPGVPLTLTATTQGPVPAGSTIRWTFNDGSPSATGQTVSHTWSNAGRYTATATLVVPGSACSESSHTGNVYVGRSDTWIPLNGTMSGDQQLSSGVAGYLITTGLTVAKGASLTIGPGVVVKGRNAAIDVLGRLVIAGTPTTPAVLTSWADDATGGDATGDGTATPPAPSQWTGIRAQSGSTVTVSDAQLRYAGTAIALEQAGAALSVTRTAMAGVGTGISTTGGAPVAVQVRDSTIESSGYGLNLQGGPSAPTVTGVTLRGRSAIGIAVGSGVIAVVEGAVFDDLARAGSLNGISTRSIFRGSTVRGRGGHLAVASSVGPGTVWSADLPYLVSRQFSVPANAQLQLSPGVVVKAELEGFFLVQGSFVTAGTGTAPVVLTSATDDSAGGDANGDGSATSPRSGEWPGLRLQGSGSVNLTRADLRYAQTAVDLQHGGTTAALTDTSLRWAGTGITATTQTRVTVRGGLVDAGSYGLNLQGTVAPTLAGTTLRRASIGVALGGGTVATVEGVVFDGVSRAASLSGPSSGSVFRGSTVVGSGGRLDVTGSTGAATTWSADLPYVLPSTFTVSSTGHLTLSPGVVVKAAAQAALQVNGALTTTGTAAVPVVMTSLSDDSVAGDTNGGTAAPYRGEWAGLRAWTGARVELAHTRVRYASTALDLAQADTVAHLEGVTLTDVTTGVSAPYASELVVEDSEIAASSTGLALSSSAANAPVISGSLVRDGSTGIAVGGAVQAVVTGNRFLRLTLGISAPAGVGVAAARNWWGVPGGPSATGAVKVSSSVSVDPWCAVEACTTYRYVDGHEDVY